MSNRRLQSCPKCRLPLDEETRDRMGLASGITLNNMCPAANGPSDGDHLLHNMHNDRLAIFEYKGEGVPLPDGQKILLDAMAGDWVELSTGRNLHTRYWVIDVGLSPDEAVKAYRKAVEWMWPGVEWMNPYDKLTKLDARRAANKA